MLDPGVATREVREQECQRQEFLSIRSSNAEGVSTTEYKKLILVKWEHKAQSNL